MLMPSSKKPRAVPTRTSMLTAKAQGMIEGASQTFWARRRASVAWAKKLPKPNPIENKYRVVNLGQAQVSSFVSNFVRTSKYTITSFVPLFLAHSFDPRSHAANSFFLVICCMQCIPYITYTLIISINGTYIGTPSTLVPLSFVIIVDAIFQALEDIARHKADYESNNSRTAVLDLQSGECMPVAWRDVRVGDVVVCKNRESVPADLVILGVAGGDGVCYVETKSLDGETNLKQRTAIKAARRRIVCREDTDDGEYPCFDTSMFGLATVEMEHPNDVIAKFEGYVSFSAVVGAQEILEAEKAAITPESVYLRGCVVRSTEWIVGLVLNTGLDTKIMKSIKEPPMKESSLVLKINKLLKFIVALLLLVCFIGATVASGWIDSEEGSTGAWYLGYTEVDSRWGSKSVRKKQASTVNAEENWVIKFFYYFLLLAQFVPVSLYVSMSMTKKFQAVFMEWDVEMYHADSDTPAKVKTMALNEELGQISHIFSDKTGTLTCNVMDFRKCSIGGRSYGKGITAIGAAALERQNLPVPAEALEANRLAMLKAVDHVTFYDPTLEAALEEESEEEKQKPIIIEFFRCLAICHTVLIETPSAATKDRQAAAARASKLALLNDSSSSKRLGARLWNHSSKLLGTLSSRAQSQPPTQSAVQALGGKKQRGTSAPAVDDEERQFRALQKEEEEDNEPKLSASSPDDEALVCGAKFFGLTFAGRKAGTMEIINAHTRETEQYEVIEMLDFNSDRKRMSVICARESEEEDDKAEIVIYVKGADTVMETRLAVGQEELKERTFEQMVGYSAEGLRTLVCGRAVLPREEFEDWLMRYRTASTDLEEIAKRQEHEPNLIDDLMDEVERAFGAGLELLGATAIEDRLQDGVPETVHSLLEAGVKIWVLTGDKEETAINIGVACQLIEPPETMEQIIVNARLYKQVCNEAESDCLARLDGSQDELETLQLVGKARKDAARLALASLFERELLKLSRQIHERPSITTKGSVFFKVKPRALIIDGEALLYALADDDEEEANLAEEQENPILVVDKEAGNVGAYVSSSTVRCRQSFLELSKHCKAVVGCRVSPMQKRLMVELVRYDPFATRKLRTLAIGDGANDVPMIQGAHVGVGISGQEGMQAVNNSDFAIAQFRYLERLMLVHGRWNYRRTSRLICHIFYKNVLQAMLNFWFASLTNMSGTKFVVEYAASTIYPVMYTAFPIILLGIFDQDVDAETALKSPELYQASAYDAHFSQKIFFGWITEGFLESLAAVVIPAVAMDATLSGADDAFDSNASVYELGAVSFTIIIVIANTKLILNQYRFTWIEVGVYFLSIASWFLLGTLYGMIPPGQLLYGYPEWEWYWVFPRLLGKPSFWFSALLAIILVFLRDFAWKAYTRMRNPQPYHIYAERAKFGLVDDDDDEVMQNVSSFYPDQLDPSLIEVPRPADLKLTAINPDLETVNVAGYQQQRKSHYHASRPWPEKQAREATDMGFAYSTDDATHLSEISAARSSVAFPHVKPGSRKS